MLTAELNQRSHAPHENLDVGRLGQFNGQGVVVGGYDIRNVVLVLAIAILHQHLEHHIRAHVVGNGVGSRCGAGSESVLLSVDSGLQRAGAITRQCFDFLDCTGQGLCSRD